VTSLVPLQGRLILPASRTGTDATPAEGSLQEVAAAV
jgi:hypothetical protein